MGTGASSPTKSRLPSPLRRKHASTHPTVAPRLIDFGAAAADQSTGCATPPRRPAVQEDAMEEEKGEETESTNYVFHISDQAARRIKVCALMEQGFSCRELAKTWVSRVPASSRSGGLSGTKRRGWVPSSMTSGDESQRR